MKISAFNHPRVSCFAQKMDTRAHILMAQSFRNLSQDYEISKKSAQNQYPRNHHDRLIHDLDKQTRLSAQRSSFAIGFIFFLVMGWNHFIKTHSMSTAVSTLFITQKVLWMFLCEGLPKSQRMIHFSSSIMGF